MGLSFRVKTNKQEGVKGHTGKKIFPIIIIIISFLSSTISAKEIELITTLKDVPYKLPLSRLIDEEKINLPKILHYDENFPYLVEEIVGYPLYKLDKQTWPLVVDAFGQLITFYKENAVKVTSVKEKLKEIEFILRKEDFKHEYVEIMKNLLKTLNDFTDKNLLITLTHGDLYLGNLVSDGKTIYITDWDFPRERLILSDFIYMLFRYYIDSGSVGVIYSLLTEEKNMHRKYIIKILEEFDKNFNIGLLSDLNMLKCYLVLGVLERIPLFESPTFQKLIFKRLKRMLHVIK